MHDGRRWAACGVGDGHPCLLRLLPAGVTEAGTPRRGAGSRARCGIPRRRRGVAERDAGEDHRAAEQLQRAERVAERERAGGGADQRLEVEERARRAPAPRATARRRTARTARPCRRRPARRSAITGVALAGACGRPSASALGSAARPPPIICTAVTANGLRPASSDGWTTTKRGADRDRQQDDRVAAERGGSPAAAGDDADAARARARSRSRRPDPQLPRPEATEISATSAGVAPTISAAWLTRGALDAQRSGARSRRRSRPRRRRGSAA